MTKYSVEVQISIKLANQGNQNEQFKIAEMYYYGENGVEKNWKLSKRYYEMAAERGNIKALVVLGCIYNEQFEDDEYSYYIIKDNSKSIDYYRRAADKGCEFAQFYIGKMYTQGTGVIHYDNKAVHYYKLSADQGYNLSQNSLANIYKKDGIFQNYSEALRYFKLAADQGCLDSKFNIGKMYEEGIDVIQDDVKAASYYKLAADKGHCGAGFKLAALHICGKLDSLNNKADAIRIYFKIFNYKECVSESCKDRAFTEILKFACDKELVAKFCFGCGKERKLKTCARCKVAKFCSTKCVQSEWQCHKPNCKTWENECE